MADLRDLPAVRAAAERLARSHVNTYNAVYARYTGMALRQWGVSFTEREICIDTELDLLCDLTRPASRDAVARLVAANLGVEIEATAPYLWRDDSFHEDWGGAAWKLGYVGNRVACFTDVCPDDFYTRDLWFDVLGISAITDPAKALRLIALHVLGSHNV